MRAGPARSGHPLAVVAAVVGLVLILGPVTALPAMGLAAPGWWPGAGGALLAYLATLAAIMAGATLAQVRRGRRAGT